MPETDDVTRAIDMFKGLPRERQAALLQRMSPEQKDKILAGLKARTGPALSMQQSQRQAIDSEMEKANPGSMVKRDPFTGEVTMTQPGTLASRAREAAIGVLEPLSGQALLSTIKQGGEAFWDALIHEDPTKAMDMIKGVVTGPVQPVKELYRGVTTGNYEQAAHGAGGFASQTAPAILGAREAGSGIINATENAAREFSQNRLGANAFRTTEPIVNKYNRGLAAVPERQAAADAAAAEKNAAATADAAEKTKARQAEVDAKNQQSIKDAQEKTAADVARVNQKNEMAMHEADIKTEETAADTLAKNNADRIAHEQAVKEATDYNAKVDADANRAANLDSQLREGSEQLGNDIVDFEKKLKAEGDLKYEAVKAKIKGDAGVPTEEMVAAVHEAEKELKGSPENIKQFRDILKQGEEGESGIPSPFIDGGVMSGGILFGPETDVFKSVMKEQQALAGAGEGASISFDDLRGYSSELGAKLAKGGLQSDVFRAIKALKEKIDAAKMKVAARHEAASELQQADAFWERYKDAMFNPESAVAQVRGKVGVVDPEFYSEPFTKGKSAGVGSSKLRGLPTQFTDIANGIADMADRLKKAYEERGTVKIPNRKEVPAPPTTRTPGPRAMATLQPEPGPVSPVVHSPAEPVVAKVTTAETVQPPKAPTAEEIVAKKRQAVQSRGQSVGEIRHVSAFEMLTLPMKSIISNIVKRPAVMEWISRPTVSDFAAIENLPEPQRAQIRTKLQQIIAEETRAGKPPRIDPKVQSFLGMAAPATNTTGAAVRNRREAMDALGQPVP